jgi:hypothetical protein
MINSVFIVVYIFVFSTKIQKITLETLFFSEGLNDLIL